MTIYITSDLHFGHKQIMKFCADTRPYTDTDEMNQALVDYWNDTVQEDDTVYHLGDFSFMNRTRTRAILEQLSGNKVFIIGNHDRGNENVLSDFGDVHDYLRKRFTYNDEQVQVVLFHFPITYWDMCDHGSIHLFGHMHGDHKPDNRSMDVGWDAHGRFLTMDEAISKMKEVEIKNRR